MNITGITPNPIKSPQFPHIFSAPSKTAAATTSSRFDTFTLVGADKECDKSENSQNTAEAKELDAKTKELVKSLSALSAEDKQELAFDSYLDMQQSLLYMKDMIYFQADYFKELKDKKAYYTDLIDSNGIIGEGGGQFKFLGKKEGEIVDIDDVYNALNRVQKSIDTFCGKIPPEIPNPNSYSEHVTGYITYEMLYDGAERMFKSASAVFSAATGITDDALKMEQGEFYFDKEGVDEDNFLEKADNLLNTIKDRSKKLGDIWSEYSYAHCRQMEKLHDRINTAEKSEEKKDASIAKMIAEYDRYLYKALGKNNLKPY